MNDAARQHLATAREFVAKGEEYYRKAAVEMIAAQKEGASQREIAEVLGRSQSWVAKIISWHRDDSGPESPFGGEISDQRMDRAARQVLRESTPREIAEMLKEPEIHRKVERAVAMSEPAWTKPKHDVPEPTLMERVGRIREEQHRVDQLMKGWSGPEAIPQEFATETFTDIAETAMAQKERVDELRAASNDEFTEIIKGLRLVKSV